MANETPAEKKKRLKNEVKYIYIMGSPEWMLTLGDCMSLLMTFFVLMLVFSDTNEGKLMDTLGAMSGGLGSVKLEGLSYAIVSEKSEVEDPHSTMSEGSDEATKVAPKKLSPVLLDTFEIERKFLTAQTKLDGIGFTYEILKKELEDGVHFFIRGGTLVSKDGKVDPDADKVLREIANFATNVPNELRLVNCMPADSSSFSWSNVLNDSHIIGKYLMDNYNIPENRFGYSGRIVQAESEPFFEIILLNPVGVNSVNIEDFLGQLKTSKKDR